MGMFNSDVELTSDGLKNLVADGKLEIVFIESNESYMQEFHVYPKDKQGKASTKILVRNHIDGARSDKVMKHDATIKVYDPDRDAWVPVFVELDEKGNPEIPEDMRNSSEGQDNIKFIKSRQKMLKRFLTDEKENLQEYWVANSRLPEDKARMNQIQNNMEDKYPFKKKKN